MFNIRLQKMDMSEAIAVVGLDLKFPGDATSPESFYEMLQSGRSALSDVPSDRYNLDAFYHPDQERAGTVSRHGIFAEIYSSCLLIGS